MAVGYEHIWYDYECKAFHTKPAILRRLSAYMILVSFRHVHMRSKRQLKVYKQLFIQLCRCGNFFDFPLSFVICVYAGIQSISISICAYQKTKTYMVTTRKCRLPLFSFNFARNLHGCLGYVCIYIIAEPFFRSTQLFPILEMQPEPAATSKRRSIVVQVAWGILRQIFFTATISRMCGSDISHARRHEQNDGHVTLSKYHVVSV